MQKRNKRGCYSKNETALLQLIPQDVLRGGSIQYKQRRRAIAPSLSKTQKSALSRLRRREMNIVYAQTARQRKVDKAIIERDEARNKMHRLQKENDNLRRRLQLPLGCQGLAVFCTDTIEGADTAQQAS